MSGNAVDRSASPCSMEERMTKPPDTKISQMEEYRNCQPGVRRTSGSAPYVAMSKIDDAIDAVPHAAMS